jgi:predicted DNA-binding transcriptional regulator AlpA
MTPELFSIEHAPASLPYWQTILDDLGRPPVRRVARVLGLGERTVFRYHQRNHAPRAVMLALFWLTRWGRSAVHTQATNDAVMAVGLVRGLNDRVGQLTRQLIDLQRLGDFGAANAPLADGLGYGGGPSPHGELRCSGPEAPDPQTLPVAGCAVGSPQVIAARPEKLHSRPRTQHPPVTTDQAGRGPGGGQGLPQAPQGRRPGTVRPASPGGRRRRPA